jgi:HNH endonuclease
MPAEWITPQWMIEQGFSPTLARRFFSKINRDGPLPAIWKCLGPCHLWTGGKASHRYGMITRGKATLGMETAPRIAWMLANGPIPEGKWVLHNCDNRACVNPAHLFLGTRQDNIADWVARGPMRPGPGNKVPGEDNASAKLTWPEVREIRHLRETQHLSYKELMARFQITLATVHCIVHKKTWIE